MNAGFARRMAATRASGADILAREPATPPHPTSPGMPQDSPNSDAILAVARTSRRQRHRAGGRRACSRRRRRHPAEQLLASGRSSVLLPRRARAWRASRRMCAASKRDAKRSSCSVARRTASSSASARSGRSASASRARFHERDARLIRERVAAAVVDRAERLARIVRVEERARSVVDRLAGDRRVVGVHHAVHEADAEPARDQARLRARRRDRGAPARRCRCPRRRGSGARARTTSAVASASTSPRAAKNSKVPTRIWLAATRVSTAPGRASSRRTRLARRDGGERARRRDAERGHRLAHDVLAQHRPERGAPVAAAREGRAPRALELDVAPLAVLADDLAEQDRATVAELRDEVAELVARVGQRDRLRAVGQRRCRPAPAPLRVTRAASASRPSSSASGRLTFTTRGRAHLRRRDARVEATREARVGVVESEH